MNGKQAYDLLKLAEKNTTAAKIKGKLLPSWDTLPTTTRNVWNKYAELLCKIGDFVDVTLDGLGIDELSEHDDSEYDYGAEEAAWAEKRRTPEQKPSSIPTFGVASPTYGPVIFWLPERSSNPFDANNKLNAGWFIISANEHGQFQLLGPMLTDEDAYGELVRQRDLAVKWKLDVKKNVSKAPVIDAFLRSAEVVGIKKYVNS